MSKCLTVVAFALLVLSGAMGLRNIAVAHAVNSGTSLSAKSGGLSLRHCHEVEVSS